MSWSGCCWCHYVNMMDSKGPDKLRIDSENRSQVTLFSLASVVCFCFRFTFRGVCLSFWKVRFAVFSKFNCGRPQSFVKNQTTPLRYQPFLDLISILRQIQLPLRLITSSSVPAAQSWHPTYRNTESFLCFSVSPNYGWNFNTNLFASVLSTAGCPPPKSWVFSNFFKLIFESFPS